jgi:hypothetical protein
MIALSRNFNSGISSWMWENQEHKKKQSVHS